MIAALLLLQVQSAATVPCEQDPKCRIEMARARELARYQARYLRELQRYVEAAEDAADDGLPYRLQNPLGLDFFFGNSMPSYGLEVGYTPVWPIRVELFYGRGEDTRYSTTFDPSKNTGMYSDSYAKLQTWGVQQRWFLLPGIVSPVVTTGLGFSHGDYTSDVNCINCGGGSHSDFFGVTAHSVYSGVGIDVQWKWIHALLAWRFQYTFYTSVKDDAGNHDKTSEKDLRSLMDDKMEGVQLEIGARY
jgi:hypothetical protein